MMNMQQIALKMLNANPQILNTPQGQEFARILQSGDVNAGQQMANNLCQTMGITPQQAQADIQRSNFIQSIGQMFGGMR